MPIPYSQLRVVGVIRLGCSTAVCDIRARDDEISSLYVLSAFGGLR